MGRRGRPGLAADWHEPDKHSPADIYVEIAGFAPFLKQLGATHTFAVTKTHHWGNPRFQRQWLPARTSQYTIDDDFELEEFTLGTIADTQNAALLRTLWEALVTEPGTKAVARYRGNASSNPFTFQSKLAQALNSVPWVLTRGRATSGCPRMCSPTTSPTAGSRRPPTPY